MIPNTYHAYRDEIDPDRDDCYRDEIELTILKYKLALFFSPFILFNILSETAHFFGIVDRSLQLKISLFVAGLTYFCSN